MWRYFELLLLLAAPLMFGHYSPFQYHQFQNSLRLVIYRASMHLQVQQVGFGRGSRASRGGISPATYLG
jgi:hypothetical protein